MDNPDLDKNANLDDIILALLFAADEPLSVRRIAAIIEDVPAGDVKQSIDAWRRRFDEEAWSIAVEQVAGGYQLSTRSDFAPFVGRLYSKRRKLRLSRAGMETLAIVAYKQPVTRAEIESIRGVSCGGVVANLMERSLVKITGKAKVLGAPFLYGTTSEFLEYLGLNSLKDLPSMEELEALLEKETQPESAEDDVPAADLHRDEDEDEDADELEAPEEEVEATLAEEASVSDEFARALPRSPGGAATVGPNIPEPINRPLGGASRDDDANEEPTGEEQVTADEREEDR
jgi:segregation and condensation protein B